MASFGGIAPSEFWDCTFDDIMIAYKAKVDELRIIRNGINLLHRSFVEKPADILQEMPLPFDNELGGGGDTESLIDEYNRLKASGVLDG